jgi:hypothetical protein
MRRQFWLGVGLGLLLTAVTLVNVLSRSDRRLAATNSRVVASAVAIPVDAGRELCAPVPYVPQGANAVRVFAGTRGGPGGPLSVTVRDRAGVVSSGRHPAGYGTQPLLVEFDRIPRDLDVPVACMRNLGRRRVVFAGHSTPLNLAASQGRGGDDIRYDFYRPGSESWWSVAGTMATRFARAKPTWMGPWTMWAILGAVAVLWVCALYVVRLSVP